MKRMILVALLFSTAAQAQSLPDGVTATTLYEVPAPTTIPGSFTLPWGAEAFSMNGHAFVAYAMPPCQQPARWTAIAAPVPPGTYDVLIVVNPIGEGNTMYVLGTGFRLADPTTTQYFACE